MKIAAAQIDIRWHDRPANYSAARRMADAAARAGADLFVLPEMFSTGFSMDTNATEEAPDGPTRAFLRTLARETGMHVAGGFVIKDGPGRPRNASLVTAPDGADLALYHKIHQIGILDEDRHYGPGARPAPFALPGFGAACLICYDLRFPELFRTLAGACTLFLVIASWPAARQSHWDVLLPARAVENQAYVVGVNRVGKGGGYAFSGGSAVISPNGETLARAGAEETLLLAEIDAGEVLNLRRSHPFLKDRKPLHIQAGWEETTEEFRKTVQPFR
ncbi:Nitrilase/cyanide hydratase and apolipoprotein N-acyltransferase [uncultured Desulfatiglans sp.]|nr:Nitrilase/cyanide hydratase and apolipoprotein N-acyltransferase [uncultured Desulfatiglans sp.]